MSDAKRYGGLTLAEILEDPAQLRRAWVGELARDLARRAGRV